MTSHMKIVHALQDDLIDKYYNVRGDDIERKSKRNIHRQFVRDPEKHAQCLKKACKQLAKSSPTIRSTSGRYVLTHVRESLIQTGKEIRSKGLKVARSRVYDSIKLKKALHRRSRYVKTCRGQIGHLQKIGSEVEGMAMIMFMELKYPSNVALFDHEGRDIHGLFRLSEDVDDLLEEVRMMVLS